MCFYGHKRTIVHVAMTEISKTVNQSNPFPLWVNYLQHFAVVLESWVWLSSSNTCASFTSFTPNQDPIKVQIFQLCCLSLNREHLLCLSLLTLGNSRLLSYEMIYILEFLIISLCYYLTFFLFLVFSIKYLAQNKTHCNGKCGLKAFPFSTKFIVEVEAVTLSVLASDLFFLHPLWIMSLGSGETAQELRACVALV